MSASDHIQPYQMKMFMQAKELMNIPSNDFMGGTIAKMPPSIWPRFFNGALARRAPDGLSLPESIHKHGVLNPILVHEREWDGKMTEVLHNGHHRVAIAHALDPEMYLPIQYGKNTEESITKEEQYENEHGHKPLHYM